MSDLRALQSAHVRYVGRLIDWATTNGYELTWGEAYRPPEQALYNAQHGKGIVNSLHIKRLAIDLNAFKDGKFLETKEDYRPLGEFWKSLDPLCCWGGDFSRPDSDHFSLTYEGVK